MSDENGRRQAAQGAAAVRVHAREGRFHGLRRAQTCRHVLIRGEILKDFPAQAALKFALEVANFTYMSVPAGDREPLPFVQMDSHCCCPLGRLAADGRRTQMEVGRGG